MTHKPIPKEVREHCGIVDGLIRVSTGIEEAADLIADLERVLPKVVESKPLPALAAAAK